MSKERQVTAIAMWVIRTLLLGFVVYAGVKNLRGLCTLYCCASKENFVTEFSTQFKRDLEKQNRKEEKEQEKLRKEFKKAQELLLMTQGVNTKVAKKATEKFSKSVRKSRFSINKKALERMRGVSQFDQEIAPTFSKNLSARKQNSGFRLSKKSFKDFAPESSRPSTQHLKKEKSLSPVKRVTFEMLGNRPSIDKRKSSRSESRLSQRIDTQHEGGTLTIASN